MNNNVLIHINDDTLINVNQISSIDRVLRDGNTEYFIRCVDGVVYYVDNIKYGQLIEKLFYGGV